MKRFNVKVISLLLIIALFSSLFAACGKDSGNQTINETNEQTAGKANEQTADNEQPVEQSTDELALEQYEDVMKVTAYLAGGCNPPINTEDNLTKNYILENLKIDLSGVMWPVGEDSLQRINTMAVSGEIPDIIQYWTRREVFNEMADAGLLLPLDDYFKYLPDYMKNTDESILDFYRNPKDGKLYVLPSFTVSTSDPEAAIKAGNNRAFSIRTDLLVKYGNPAVNNLEGLYNFLKTVKESEDDMIPFTVIDKGWLQEFIQICFVNEPYGVKVDDSSQRILDSVYLPGYLDGLKYLAKLYRDGLMDPEVFTLTSDQNVEKVEAGRVAVHFGFIDGISKANAALEAKGVDGSFDVMEFPLASNVQPSGRLVYEPLGWSMIGISKNTQDPVRLIKFLNWGHTKTGAMTLAYGAPSKEENIWYMDGDRYIFNKEVYEKDQKGEISIGNVSGGWSYWFTIPPTWTPLYDPSQGAAEGGPGLHPIKAKHTEIIKPLLYCDPKMAYYLASPKGDNFNQKNTSVQNILWSSLAEIIMNSKDDGEVESKYNEMIKQMENAGLIDIEKENYQIYKEANAN